MLLIVSPWSLSFDSTTLIIIICAERHEFVNVSNDKCTPYFTYDNITIVSACFDSIAATESLFSSSHK